MKEIKELLELVSDEKLRKNLLNIFSDIQDELASKPAAVKHHHNKAGELYRHIKEVMNITLELYEKRPEVYDCSKDQVITASFVHDFNKIDQYVLAPEWKKIKYHQYFDKVPRIWLNESARTTRLCADYGLILDDVVLNAVCLHHASWSVDVSSPYGHVQSTDFTPLAVILHSADLISAHVLGGTNKQKKEGDENES